MKSEKLNKRYIWIGSVIRPMYFNEDGHMDFILSGESFVITEIGPNPHSHLSVRIGFEESFRVWSFPADIWEYIVPVDNYQPFLPAIAENKVRYLIHAGV